MKPAEFRRSLSDGAPPAAASAALKALWHLGRNEWDIAHRIVQDDPGRDAAWVHALVHRIEGDDWNAGYWYGQAGRARSSGSIEAEWAEIAEALLGRD